MHTRCVHWSLLTWSGCLFPSPHGGPFEKGQQRIQGISTLQWMPPMFPSEQVSFTFMPPVGLLWSSAFREQLSVRGSSEAKLRLLRSLCFADKIVESNKSLSPLVTYSFGAWVLANEHWRAWRFKDWSCSQRAQTILWHSYTSGSPGIRLFQLWQRAMKFCV